MSSSSDKIDRIKAAPVELEPSDEWLRNVRQRSFWHVYPTKTKISLRIREV